jgi:hypothetical protein
MSQKSEGQFVQALKQGAFCRLVLWLVLVCSGQRSFLHAIALLHNIAVAFYLVWKADGLLCNPGRSAFVCNETVAAPGLAMLVHPSWAKTLFPDFEDWDRNDNCFVHYRVVHST